jgi:hypothetical protein
MNINRQTAAALVLLAASTSLATAQAGEKLSAGEIAALFPGQFEAIWKNKHEVNVVAGSDGEMRGTTGIMSDSGRWSIDGDQLCVAFYWWTKNRPRCTEVVRQDGWYHGMLNSKGKPRVRFRPQ